MQREQRLVRAGRALAGVNVHVFPALQPLGLAGGQPGAHRKLGLGQEQRRAVISIRAALSSVVHRHRSMFKGSCGLVASEGAR